MKLFNNSEFPLDEILFENKNKSYGAYALRNESDQVLLKATFIGVSFFALVAFTPVVVTILKSDVVIETSSEDDLGPVILRNVDQKDPPKVAPVVKIEMPDVKIIDSRLPTPTKDPVIEKPAVKQKDLNDALVGVIDKDGQKPTTSFVPPIIEVPVGPQHPTATTPDLPKEDPNVIPTEVDVKASFIGGINAFREKVGQKIDPYNFDNEGETLQATVTFVVERDGSISQVTATGNDRQFNKEAEKAVSSIKGKWKPAQLNGKPVRSYFKIPLSMRFE